MRKFCCKTKWFLLMVVLIIWMPIWLYAGKDPFLTPWEEKKREMERLRLKQRSLQREKIFYNKNKKNDFDEGNIDIGLSPKKEEFFPVKPDLDLRGIIWSEDGTGIVIIGDKIFHTGDVVMDDCVVGAIVDGIFILKCKDNIWKYRVKDEGV